MTSPHESSERILIYAPRGRDGELATRILARFGLSGVECTSLEALVTSMKEGAGCAILTDDGLREVFKVELVRAIADQPLWSDFPLVVFTNRDRHRSVAALRSLESLGNVTVVERPVQMLSFISAVRVALRSRRQQYEARRAIAQRDQFLAMLGHELRNPLSAIMFTAEVVKRKAGDGLAKESATLERQTKHLTRLVDDLLDVSRMTSGKIKLDKRPVEMNVLAERCIQALGPIIAAKRQSVTFARGMGPLYVDGDPDRLEQVLSNVLTNASKYSPEGAPIRVAISASEAEVVISVRDQGAGIAPEMLEKVFDLFAQVESTIDRAQGGLGIGLSLVRRLVELHGGSAVAKSEGLGKGTELVIRLPRLERRDDAGDGDAHRVVPAKPRRILIIEDHPDIRSACRDVLETFGYSVELAGDGPTGLSLALADRPDAALVDIGLPGMDGYTVATRIRAAGNAMYLVAMTGYGQPSDRSRAMHAGFDAHLTKPVSGESLLEALAVLDQRESVRTA